MAAEPFNGLRILLTGASTGMGREMAKQLAAAGARVFATARDGSKLASLKSECGSSLAYLAGDITDAPFRESLVEAATEELSGIDVLINNAGAGSDRLFANSTSKDARRLIELNLVAPIELTHLCLPALLQSKRSQVVNICSVLSYSGAPGKAVYCATKYGLRGFSDALRAELRNSGVTVTVISPSTIASEFWDAIDGEKAACEKKTRRGGLASDEAARAALKAIARKQSEATFPFSGRMLVWASRFFPRWTNYFASRLAPKR